MSLLRLEEMSKMFGGLIALNDLTFDVKLAALLVLLGPTVLARLRFSTALPATTRQNQAVSFLTVNPLPARGPTRL